MSSSTSLGPAVAAPVAWTRRGWLKLAAGAIAVAAGTGAVAWTHRHRLKWLQAADAEAMLRAQFHYLKLEITSADMQRFYADYTRHYGRVPRDGIYRYWERRPDSYYTDAVDTLATTFLLSTTFFLYGGDENRPVTYVMLYHPYASPCWNPLSLHARTAQVASPDPV
jgi:hypothetical protein